MHHTLRTSLTRIADFTENDPVQALPREAWEWGDYVVAEVTEAPGMERWIELPNGRLINVAAGDRLFGALGTRFATLTMTGTWKQVGPDGRMQVLTPAGLFGRVTSLSPYELPPIQITYRGHVFVQGRKAVMSAYAAPDTGQRFATPVVLVLGSSMSCGKTSAAREVIRRLKVMGLSVVAAKLTGAGRYRDVLSMQDAGADAVFDFVDAGLPSTVCPEAVYREQVLRLLSVMALRPAHVAVIEAGASPKEPYNGVTAAALLAAQTKLCILCATDPYAALALAHAVKPAPDLIAGMACSTLAGVELLHALCPIPGLNLVEPSSHAALDTWLRRRLGLAPA